MKNTLQKRPPKLTKRETEVISLLAEYLSAEQIAAKLFISPKTVYNHRENMLRKFGIKSCIELVDKWRCGEISQSSRDLKNRNYSYFLFRI